MVASLTMQRSHEQVKSNVGVASQKADNDNSSKNGVKRHKREAWQ